MPTIGDNRVVTYDNLDTFASSLCMPFDRDPFQVNIIVLRGTMPLVSDDLQAELIDTRNEIQTEINTYDRLHSIQADLRQQYNPLKRTLTTILNAAGENAAADGIINVARGQQHPNLRQDLQPILQRVQQLILEAQAPALTPLRAPLRSMVFLLVFCDILWQVEDVRLRHLANPDLDIQLPPAFNQNLAQANRRQLVNALNIQDVRNATNVISALTGTIRDLVAQLLQPNNQLGISDDQERNLRLVENVFNQYNDTIIFAWKDEMQRGHMRAVVGSADPGKTKLENPTDSQGNPLEGVASVASGSYSARWNLHGGDYPSLLLLRGGLLNESHGFMGRRIPHSPNAANRGYHIDNQDNITITKFVYREISAIEIHAAGCPPNTIAEWLGGCIGVASTNSTYEEIAGESDYNEPDAWLSMDIATPAEIRAKQSRGEGDPYPANRYNVIIWNGWSLFSLLENGAGYRPSVEFGTEDPAQAQLRGLADAGWVGYMQTRLEVRRDTVNGFIQGHQDLNLNGMPDIGQPDGKFGDNTGRSLRAFQKACYVLLGGQAGNMRYDYEIQADQQGQANQPAGNNQQPQFQLELDLGLANQVDLARLRQEYLDWLCGEETWELLESDTFQIVEIQQADE